MKKLIILIMAFFSFVFTEEICGTIDTDTTFDAATDWLLTCQTFVQSGVTVTFEAGTTVKSLSDDGTGLAPALIFTQGSTIMAEGTADAPITFTSALTPEELAASPRGNWGGLIILGNAPISTTGGVNFVEGVTGQPYGGSDAADDSGVMRYVRVWHGGRSIGQDNEINGITLAGVGNGTTVDHCEVAYNLDDGFEMFGGTVDLTYCSVIDVGDDAFDTDEGYQGRGQFLYVHRAADSDKAHEMDSKTNSNFDSQPRSHPQFSNVTVMGGGAAGNPEDGLRLREGTGGDFRNYIIMDVADDAIRNDDNGSELVTQDLASTTGLYPDYLYVSPNTLMYGIGNQLFSDFDDSGDSWVAVVADPGLMDSADGIDVTPVLGGPAYDMVDAVSGWHTTVNYKGAFGTTNWLDGWSYLSGSFVEQEITGDANGDGLVNVVDIVALVGVILNNGQYNLSLDLNNDGILNVVDVVAIVNYILNGNGLSTSNTAATEAVIETASNELSVRGVNGTVDGVQLTLSHGADFSIDLVETSGIEVAAQKSIDENTTIVLVAKKDLTHIGTTTGDYTIVDHVVVATNRGVVVEVLTTTATEIVDFRLGKAYPNPFNPTTNLELAIPEAGYVSVKVYNLVG